ncbi:hypothetical protein E2C01_035872 [Portunus trituberculatus]|uniref:Uncharacterized protein n=1 Tax=Portunus trituberculatus TaxID=210409 RepID=A0A5B7F9J2_PORTR|nr:hypothetical protein [Portunus trituberculatus]
MPLEETCITAQGEGKPTHRTSLRKSNRCMGENNRNIFFNVYRVYHQGKQADTFAPAPDPEAPSPDTKNHWTGRIRYLEVTDHSKELNGWMIIKIDKGSPKFPTVGGHCKTKAQLRGSPLGKLDDPPGTTGNPGAPLSTHWI